eukprot:360529-Chlamydomonas_euryale.AAC.2
MRGRERSRALTSVVQSTTHPAPTKKSATRTERGARPVAASTASTRACMRAASAARHSGAAIPEACSGGGSGGGGYGGAGGGGVSSWRFGLAQMTRERYRVPAAVQGTDGVPAAPSLAHAGAEPRLRRIQGCWTHSRLLDAFKAATHSRLMDAFKADGRIQG